MDLCIIAIWKDANKFHTLNYHSFKRSGVFSLISRILDKDEIFKKNFIESEFVDFMHSYIFLNRPQSYFHSMWTNCPLHLDMNADTFLERVGRNTFFFFSFLHFFKKIKPFFLHVEFLFLCSRNTFFLHKTFFSELLCFFTFFLSNKNFFSYKI